MYPLPQAQHKQCWLCTTFTHGELPQSYKFPVIVLTRPEYVQKYANKDAADEAGQESEDDDDLSSVASFDEDEEPAGQMDDV